MIINTRQPSKLHHKTHNTYIRAYSVGIRGITLWNLLSHHIISSPPICIFKRKYRNFWLNLIALINVNPGLFVNSFTVYTNMHSIHIIVYGSPFISSSLGGLCLNQFSLLKLNDCVMLIDWPTVINYVMLCYAMFNI